MRKTINFRSADGVSNTLSLYAANDSQHAVLICPAMGVPARNYIKLAESLQARGVSAAVFDLRGIGESSVRASRESDFGYHEIVDFDYPAALESLRTALPQANITLFGHSLGGQLACLYLSQNPQVSNSLVLCASCSVFYRGWPVPIRWGLLFFTQLASLIARVLGYFPGRKLGFAGLEARTVMRDWAATARHGRYQVANSHVDYEADMAKLNIRVLAINFSDDTLAPVAASRNLTAKLGDAKLTQQVINGEQLGQHKANHFNWSRSPEVIADRVVSWLQQPLVK